MTTTTTPTDTTVNKNSGNLARVLVILLLLALGGVSGFLVQQQLLLKQDLAQSKAQLQQTNAATQSSLTELQQRLAQLEEQNQKLAEQNGSAISSIQESLNSQNERLMTLSTTDRNDWLLAEAQYLLSLANQRLVIEREASTANALLAAADNILAGIDIIELRTVRQAIKSEQIALQLASAFDREGLFLEIAALSDQIDKLSLFKMPEIILDKPSEIVSTEGLSFWEKFKQSIAMSIDDLQFLVRVRELSKPVEPILPPDSHQYLKQNLRFMLEQAQLALLKEQSQVYRNALLKAHQWIEQYYAINERESQVILARLAEIAEINIQQPIPDITQSRNQLEAYIKKEHQIKPAPQSDDKTVQLNNSIIDSPTVGGAKAKGV